MSKERYQNSFQALKMNLPGYTSAWVKKLRETAIENFVQNGFPTTRDEQWKHTSLRGFEEKIFRVDVACHRDPHPQPLSHESERGEEATVSLPLQAGEDYINLVFIDGVYSPTESSALPASIQLLSNSLNHQSETLKPFLNQLCVQDTSFQWHNNSKYDSASLPLSNSTEAPQYPSSQAFSALNSAFMQEGVFIKIAANQALKINLLFISTQKNASNAWHWRNILVLEENASATVMETYQGINDATYLTNTLSEIFLGKNANLIHYKWQNESRKASHFGKIYVDQSQPGSQFTNHTISLGAELSRSDIHVALKAEKTHCTLNGLYNLSNKQHMDHQTTIDHQAPDAISRELYKGILDEKSQGVFNGRVMVRKDAQKTSSEQHNHNLLLSLDAQINTKPQLEILADDVKCAHGATVGQLDENAMFYLRSRGLDETTARKILVQAFFTEVLERMSDHFMKEQVKQCL